MGVPAAPRRIGEDPATLLEVLDYLPGALYHWVVEQTLTALGEGGEDTPQPSTESGSDETLVSAEVHQLALEVLRLAHASDVLPVSAHSLPLLASTPSRQDPRQRRW